MCLGVRPCQYLFGSVSLIMLLLSPEIKKLNLFNKLFRLSLMVKQIKIYNQQMTTWPGFNLLKRKEEKWLNYMIYNALIYIPGHTYIGLLQTCVTIYGRPTTCFTPDNIRGEWVLTFLCITIGVICVTITIILLAISYWKYEVVKYARWLGFTASK